MPSQNELSQKSSSLHSLAVLDPAKLCFGVNVKNVSLPRPANPACEIDRGMTAGFVLPGESITLNDVDSANIYDFELYAFQKDTAAQPCPAFVVGTKINGTKTYLVGSATQVTVKGPEANVEIVYSLSSSIPNIATQNSWPASCLGNVSSQKSKGHILTAAGFHFSGANFHLYSKISPLNDLKTIGTNIKITRGKVSQ
jgi:hypothetical protein